MTATATIRPSITSRVRPLLPWITTVLAFPPAGYVGHLVAGPVDGIGPALLGGFITGALLGSAQFLALRSRGVSPTWILSTAVGLGVGLAAGAALVSYGTSLGNLMAMGAVSGAVLGLAQVAGSGRLRRRGISWVAASCALFAIGWAVTTAAGIDVEEQYTLFGLSGALVVTVLQSVFANRFLPVVRIARNDSNHG